ncbi:glycoside hydrolase family 43 protein [Wenyingzhuangia marina]|uniref:Beta-xylosidase n=1 Tax=Wenyingzhuangia marina TaxID=1195760 RepID=A0A1M5TTB1_9FLAO|nr:glycoside hydrolase 43 family protein [Wenyingzhuangia marina]GGF71069.1 glycosyl hydrolase [Wenyingzhuangia marina]SHH54065.1 Beta-xylosidase [Wenyingzhuangia marina]
MKFRYFIQIALILFTINNYGQDNKAHNPIIYADVPDASIIRVENTYYMSSTTMHMSPGVPIMKSNDLVNWELVSYAYDRLDEVDAMNLENGKSTYGRGSWASCLRYHKGVFYVSTFAATTGKTYIYSTKNIEKGPWKKISFSPAYHDHSILFENNKAYIVWGAGKISIAELKEDLSDIKEETKRVLIENATAPSGDNIMLPAEGSQLFKIRGKYYLFNISWPRGGMRTVIIHKADNLSGPWEGRVALQDKGVAQGGLVSTPKGEWFSYLFKDNGGVGRIPYIVPVKWVNDWPVLGENGKVPSTLDLPKSKGLIPGIVNSDNFDRKKNEKDLPLVWQWNHNPNNDLWSVKDRKGFLRLKTGRVDTLLVQAKNTLTQRTIGPESKATTLLDVSNMNEGDVSGLCLLQKQYGFIAVKKENGIKKIIMVSAASGTEKELGSIPLKQNQVYFKAECDFKNQKDSGQFYYSLDGKKWESLGDLIKLPYTLPHFMGYRFGLFNYATKQIGGFVDFDYFNISDKISE